MVEQPRGGPQRTRLSGYRHGLRQWKPQLELGWEVEEILVRSADTGLGEVVAVEPVSGTLLADGETITLFVSLGEPLVAAPDIYALSVEEATSTVEALGLDVVGSTPVNDERVPDGFAVGLDLPEGVYELEAGS